MFDDMFSRFNAVHECDRQTERDRQTDRQHIYPTRIASRGGETGP